MSHIFWSCLKVKQFWQDLVSWLGTLECLLTLDKKNALFGFHDKNIHAKENYIVLFSKYFIWKAKFTTKDLSLDLFKKYLFNKLNDLKNALSYAENDNQFSQWYIIYDSLSRLPSCSEQEAAPMPLNPAPVVATPGIQTPHHPLAAGRALEADQPQTAAGTHPLPQAPADGSQEQATGSQLPDQAPTEQP